MAILRALAFIALLAGTADAQQIQRIVVFDSATPPAQRVSIARTSGGQIVRELTLINAVVIAVPPAQIQSAEIKLKKRSEVRRIDEDPKIDWLKAVSAVRDVPLPDAKAFLSPLKLTGRGAVKESTQRLPWGISRVNAAGAWAKTRGEGVKVVVIDTGIDMTHPDLKDLIVGGWNATSKEKPADFNDDNGHGSHVSGTIAAVDNEFGVIGVAPKAALYGVKVLDANGSGTFSDVIAGMQWAVDNKMQVANMSLGASKGNPSLEAAVTAMAKAGVVLMAAAGNSGRAVGFPAAYADAIAIAASDNKDKTAYFSSRGPEVDFIAPGVDVDSTYMGGAYDSLSGTSMATPHMAGLAALAIAAQGISGPDAVRAALSKAATTLPGIPAEQQGLGLVDAGKLVK